MTCPLCNDTGYISKTEWTEIDGKDIDYEVIVKCECNQDE